MSHINRKGKTFVSAMIIFSVCFATNIQYLKVMGQNAKIHNVQAIKI